MKTKLIKLSKKWSHYQAGETIELEAGKANRIAKKGFGVLVTRKARTEKPAPENKMANPEPQPVTPPEPSDER